MHLITGRVSTHAQLNDPQILILAMAPCIRVSYTFLPTLPGPHWFASVPHLSHKGACLKCHLPFALGLHTMLANEAAAAQGG